MNRRNRYDQSRHGPDCTCGCQEEPIRVTAHDISVAASVKLTLNMDYEAGKATVEKILTDAASEIASLGGIVGHLKARITDQSRSCVISVTDEESADCTEYPDVRVQVECACICMALEPEELKEILGRLLAPYLP